MGEVHGLIGLNIYLGHLHFISLIGLLGFAYWAFGPRLSVSHQGVHNCNFSFIFLIVVCLFDYLTQFRYGDPNK